MIQGGPFVTAPPFYYNKVLYNINKVSTPQVEMLRAV